MTERRLRLPHATILVAALALAAQACGGGGDGNTTPTPAITIAVSPTSASVVQGASTSVTATVTGTGGFTGTGATAAVTGAPAGVTFAISNIQTTGSTTTITVVASVAASVAPGTYPLTVTASGSGVSPVSTTFSLTVTAAPVSSYALSLSPTSLSVAQGANGTATVNLARTNFTGGVTLTAEGLPSGVTAAFNATPATGNTSTLTLTAGASAATGTSNVTIRGAATGLADQTATLALTVTATASGSYTLSATPAAVSVNQGASGTSTINVTRTGGFAGNVALAVTGAPAGVTATLSPTSTTGNTSTLTIAAAAGATTGAATLTITGTATGLANQTTTVALTVGTSGGSGNVTLDYSACTGASASLKPIWVAAQDGTGAWTRVTATNDVYKFNVTSGKGGFAVATQSGGSTTVSVSLFTQAELTSAPEVFCTTPSTRSATGTVAGLGASDAATISMGDASQTVVASAPSFTLNNMLTGQQDLVGYRTNFLAGPAATDRAVIIRDLNPPSGGSVGTVDFNGSAAITPVPGTITVTGGAAGDTYSFIMSYLTGANCTSATLYFSAGGTSPSLSAFGIPAASQRSTDFHQILLSETSSGTSSRGVFESFHTFGNRSIAVGAVLPTPTVTSLTAPYKRLQAALSIPSDYQTSASLEYSQTTKFADVTASFGYLGGSTATLAFPDLSGVAGFDATWLPASGASVSTSVTVAGANVAITSPVFSFCSEGLRFKFASFSGTF
jgi:hypothetical protein